MVGALAAQGSELLLVPHQQHRVASHHHLPEPAGEVERWAPWGAEAQTRAAPSANNMAAANMAGANMAATNMAAVATVVPPLLPAGLTAAGRDWVLTLHPQHLPLCRPQW